MAGGNDHCVEIIDVSPRDGLQNETVHLATVEKAGADPASAGGGAAADRGCELRPAPSWLPQMADARGRW